jgi:alpha-glucoside transport system substrate-binding protein
MRQPARAFTASAMAIAMSIGLLANAATAGTRDPAGGGRIEVAAVWKDVEQDRFRSVLDAFTDKTGIDVTYTSTSDDIAVALAPRIDADDPPDVAMIPQPGLLDDFARDGALVSIEDVAGAAVERNYAPVWRELGTVDGALYAVWFKGANKSLVWYNRSFYKDAGVRPADSFDALLQNQQTLADFGVAPLAVGAADGWTLTDIFENIYLAQVGPDTYARLARHEIPWTDATVKDALRSMAQLVSPELLPGGPTSALQTEFAGSVQQVFGEDPAAAALIEGDFVANEINGTTEARVGKQARVFSFPPMDGGQPPVVAGGDAAVLMRDRAGGRKLIKFLASPAAAEVWARKGGYLSPNRNVDASVYPNATVRAMARNLVESRNLYFDLSDLQPPAFGATDGQGAWKIFQEFLADPSDIDGTAQELEDAASQAFGS